ncbi:hypothetical protein AVEN_15462-1 [Araneus ventricosus]|uniref:Uncharacterized protein n=1 Tax=Araneus ventricosus TaxID=182803 RepID=A0A4Y2EEE9_ARAVE|nr:hypothetical protein AVEN_15462-1 [Araneus ventricosus]
MGTVVLGFSNHTRRWRALSFPEGRGLFLMSRVANSKARGRFRKAPTSEAGDPNEKCSCKIDVVDREGSRRIFFSVLLLAAKDPNAYSELCFVKLTA